jgi:hypothetical protein
LLFPLFNANIHLYMKQTQQPPQPAGDEPAPTTADRSTVLLLLGTVGDTSLRLFIPTIGATALGLWADNQFGTTPWATALGVLLGATIAISLVYAQLQKVNREQKK